MRNLGRWLSEHKWSVALAAIVSVGAAVVATFEYFGEFNSASDESASGPIDSIDSMPPATYAPTPDYRESFPESEMRLNDSGEGLLSLVPGIYDVYNFESGTYQQIILNPPNIRIWDPYTGAEILTGVIDPETNIVTDSQGQQFRLSDLSDGFDVFRRDSQPDITASAAPEAAPPPAAMITQADSEREAQAEQIREYFDQLEEGDFFHNVPEEMQVNVETVIEAGIAKEATNLVLERLGLEEEDVTLRTDAVRYDPLGTEVILWADEDAFEVTPIKGGQQTVFEGDEQLWSWRVQPLQAGQHLIVLKAKVEFKPEGSDRTITREFVTFEEKRRVKVNVAYSFQRLAESNLSTIIGLIIGPGSVAGVVSWWYGKRQAKQAEAKKKPSQGLVETFLASSGEEQRG